MNAIDAFDGMAPQFDNITMLSFHVYSEEEKIYCPREITLDAKIENIEPLTAFVDQALQDYACPMKVQMQVDIALDEIFSNIAHYAYTPRTGTATVKIEKLFAPDGVKIVFTDSGLPFDPLKKADPNVNAPLEERSIGGLGIYMVLAYQFLIYDQLTGAFSRDGFRLNFQNRRARDGVLAMIDLNGLKEINDAQGHEVGDHALYQFSQILLHSKMRPSRLYRYGGDEFVLLVKKSNVKAVQVMLAKCAIDAAALEVPLSFSYGVVEVHNGDDFYSRLQEADTLMYEMKRTMKNGAEKKPISQADI